VSSLRSSLPERGGEEKENLPRQHFCAPPETLKCADISLAHPQCMSLEFCCFSCGRSVRARRQLRFSPTTDSAVRKRHH
jgi:hypothetical protein